MGFSGLWVVWSLLGAPGEKKKEKTKCIYKICIPLHRSESKNSRKFRQHFAFFWLKFSKISIRISVFHTDFHEISSEFHENFTEFQQISKN